jgi:hypothetical protein
MNNETTQTPAQWHSDAAPGDDLGAMPCNDSAAGYLTRVSGS